MGPEIASETPHLARGVLAISISHLTTPKGRRVRPLSTALQRRHAWISLRRLLRSLSVLARGCRAGAPRRRAPSRAGTTRRPRTTPRRRGRAGRRRPIRVAKPGCAPPSPLAQGTARASRVSSKCCARGSRASRCPTMDARAWGGMLALIDHAVKGAVPATREDLVLRARADTNGELLLDARQGLRRPPATASTREVHARLAALSASLVARAPREERLRQHSPGPCGRRW